MNSYFTERKSYSLAISTFLAFYLLEMNVCIVYTYAMS